VETVITLDGAGVSGTNVVLSGKMARAWKRVEMRKGKRILLESCSGNLESLQKLWDGTTRKRLLLTMNVNETVYQINQFRAEKITDYKPGIVAGRDFL